MNLYTPTSLLKTGYQGYTHKICYWSLDPLKPVCQSCKFVSSSVAAMRFTAFVFVVLICCACIFNSATDAQKAAASGDDGSSGVNLSLPNGQPLRIESPSCPENRVWSNAAKRCLIGNQTIRLANTKILFKCAQGFIITNNVKLSL